MQDKVNALCENIRRLFYSKTFVEGRKRNVDFDINLEIELVGKEIHLTFSKREESHLVSIPAPYERDGLKLISFNNGVERALCNYFVEENQMELDFCALMFYIVCGDPTGIIPLKLVKKSPYLQQIITAFKYNNASGVIYNLQRAINEVVNRMPLHETKMNSFIMNRRLIIIDPNFDELVDPKEKLDYHIEKNKKYFPRGWTSIGLSDGALANRNYILKCDIRKLAPFGLRHHNPQRNLYSTLTMYGEEDPLIRSEAIQKLMDKGIDRKGWNLFTAFVDIPDVFEDQIMVDVSHKSKFINHTRRYQCFGNVTAQKGEKLKYNQVLSFNEDGEKILFNTKADDAVVEDITKSTINVGGMPVDVYNVIVRYRRHFRDGTKITNLHGNKGVIRLKKLGYAIDPKTGEKRKIDVIASGKSVKKRKNFGQILEALANTIYGGEVKVWSNDVSTTEEQIRIRLKKEGYPEDGAWECRTYAGNLKGICGKVFWGVTKEPEDQLWDYNATIRKNGRDIRTAGLKFSTVEFRSLITRFGKDNPIIDEILSYVQGNEDLHEQLDILRAKFNKLPTNLPTLCLDKVSPLVPKTGTMFSEEEIEGTVVDDKFQPDGFILKIPVPYQVGVDKEFETIEEGVPRENHGEDVHRVFTFEKLFIPSGNLRRCWKHNVGKYGLSDIGTFVNNIVKNCHAYVDNPHDPTNVRLLYMSIHNYFLSVADRLGTKRGEISTYGMAVRYPFSAKATATLSNSLPKNTIEIHRSMAKKLNVRTGDIVLAERFPCLGFMSIRPQKVRVTGDPLCKYTIRVSGNSLVSMSLDFDGDVLFLASFHSKAAKTMLRKEWNNPNKSCYDVIKELNKKAGTPHAKSMALDDYQLMTFKDLSADDQALLVERATGVKSHTGPVIALAYNVMRILENSNIKDNQKTNVAVEVFLDKVGNSVFKQKHGVQSLHDIVIDAICTADVETLVKHGFNRGTSTIICDIIKKKAKEVGVRDVKSYHAWTKANGRSKLINVIVRKQNKIYFASRAQLEGCKLLSHLYSKAVDWPSKMLKRVLSFKSEGKMTEWDKYLDKKNGLGTIKDAAIKEAGSTLCDYVSKLLMQTDRHVQSTLAMSKKHHCLEIPACKRHNDANRRHYMFGR